MTIFQAEPQEGDIKNPPREQGVEPAVDNLDTPVADPPAPAPAAGEDDAPADPPLRRVAGVDRAAIGRKFTASRRRDNEDIPFDGNFAREQVYAGNLTREVPDEPAAPEPDATVTDPAAQARERGPSDSPPATKKKLVVRREEIEVDDNELTRLAQIGAAGESYLTEAKRLRDEAEALRKAAVSHPHPDAGRSAPAERADDPADPPHQDDLDDIIEKLQFGSKDEGKEAIREIVAKAANPDAARIAVYEHHATQELGRAQQALRAFRADPANAELIADPDTEAMMERKFYDAVRKDLRDLGMTDDQIPADTRKLVDTHMFHRVHGKPVRDTAALLAASKQAFLDWRGGPKPSPQPQPAPRRPGVQVNLDRTERRAAMPHQPARASAPPVAQPRQSPQAARGRAVATILKNRGRALVT